MTHVECWSDGAGLLQWTGPILDKELRTTSRRKRYYFLRVGYIALLAILLAQVWFFSMMSGFKGSSAFQASRMSEVALHTTIAIQWFEFICLQVLALVMLSGSISDEIRKNTLEALLSCPISSTQVVLGKLLARMWQLILLAGISVPVLVVLRVMGGVSLDFVLAGTCITVTAAMTTGLISLYCSISKRPAYRVIYLAVIACLLLYVIMPILLSLLKLAMIQVPSWIESAALLLNPFVAFGAVSGALMGAKASAASLYPWPVHCMAMLGLCAVLTALAVRKVRMVTIAERTDIKGCVRRLLIRSSKITDSLPSDDTVSTAFPEKRNPVACKELRTVGFWGFGGRWKTYVLAAGISMLYGGVWFFGVLHEKVFHGVVVELLVIYGIFQIATFSARAIVTEKEGRTWVPLLTTPLSDKQIMSGKMEAVLRRTIPVWLWLTIHVIVFVLIGLISPIALFTIPLIVIPVIILLMGLGFYFSARLKSSTGAVVATYVIPLALWLVCPCLASFSPLFWLPMSLFVKTGDVLASLYSSGAVLIFPMICLVQLIITLATGWFLLKRAQKRIRLSTFDNP